MSAANFISVSPRKKLTIYLKKEQETIVAFRVTNIISDSVVCNINSNQKELYVVQPTRFLLKPGECKLVSIRCKKSVVNSLVDGVLPTNNQIKLLSYLINGDLLDSIENSSEKVEKENIQTNWERITKCASKSYFLDVRFTNILFHHFHHSLFLSFVANAADVTYSTCASPVNEMEDCSHSGISHMSLSHSTIIATIVTVGLAVLINYVYHHWN